MCSEGTAHTTLDIVWELGQERQVKAKVLILHTRQLILSQSSSTHIVQILQQQVHRLRGQGRCSQDPAEAPTLSCVPALGVNRAVRSHPSPKDAQGIRNSLQLHVQVRRPRGSCWDQKTPDQRLFRNPQAVLGGERWWWFPSEI